MKEQTHNCYVLEGLRAFLETGSGQFRDADAVALCEHYGCRSATNHATYRNTIGNNKVTGGRRQGFTLVAPGMTHGAALVRKIVGTPEAKD